MRTMNINHVVLTGRLTSDPDLRTLPSGMLADGISDTEILAAYPDLEAEDIREEMRYAAEAVRERELPLAVAG